MALTPKPADVDEYGFPIVDVGGEQKQDDVDEYGFPIVDVSTDSPDVDEFGFKIVDVSDKTQPSGYQEPDDTLYPEQSTVPELLRRPGSAPAYDAGLSTSSIEKGTQEAMKTPINIVKEAREKHPEFYSRMTDEEVRSFLENQGKEEEAPLTEQLTSFAKRLSGEEPEQPKALTEEEQTNLIRQARERDPERYSGMTNEEVLAEIENPYKETKGGETSVIMDALRSDKAMELYTKDAIIQRITEAGMRGEDLSYEKAESEVYNDMVQTLGDLGAGVYFSLLAGWTNASTALGRMATVGAKEGVVNVGLEAHKDTREGKEVTATGMAKDFTAGAAMGALGQGAGELIGKAVTYARGLLPDGSTPKSLNEFIEARPEIKTMTPAKKEVELQQLDEAFSAYVKPLVERSQKIGNDDASEHFVRQIQEATANYNARVAVINEKYPDYKKFSAYDPRTDLPLETTSKQKSMIDKIYSEVDETEVAFANYSKAQKIDEIAKDLGSDVTKVKKGQVKNAISSVEDATLKKQLEGLISEDPIVKKEAQDFFTKDNGINIEMLKDQALMLKSTSDDFFNEGGSSYTALSSLMNQGGWVGRAAVDTSYINNNLLDKTGRFIETGMLGGLVGDVRNKAFNATQKKVRQDAVQAIEGQITELRGILKDPTASSSLKKGKRHELEEITKVKSSLIGEKPVDVEAVGKSFEYLPRDVQLKVGNAVSLQHYSSKFGPKKGVDPLKAATRFVPQAFLTYSAGLPIAASVGGLSGFARIMSQLGKKKTLKLSGNVVRASEDYAKNAKAYERLAEGPWFEGKNDKMKALEKSLEKAANDLDKAYNALPKSVQTDVKKEAQKQLKSLAAREASGYYTDDLDEELDVVWGK